METYTTPGGYIWTLTDMGEVRAGAFDMGELSYNRLIDAWEFFERDNDFSEKIPSEEAAVLRVGECIDGLLPDRTAATPDPPVVVMSKELSDEDKVSLMDMKGCCTGMGLHILNDDGTTYPPGMNPLSEAERVRLRELKDLFAHAMQHNGVTDEDRTFTILDYIGGEREMLEMLMRDAEAVDQPPEGAEEKP